MQRAPETTRLARPGVHGENARLESTPDRAGRSVPAVPVPVVPAVPVPVPVVPAVAVPIAIAVTGGPDGRDHGDHAAHGELATGPDRHDRPWRLAAGDRAHHARPQAELGEPLADQAGGLAGQGSRIHLYPLGG